MPSRARRTRDQALAPRGSELPTLHDLPERDPSTKAAATGFPVIPYEDCGRRGQYVGLRDGKVFYVRKGSGFPLVLMHMFGGNSLFGGISWWYSRVFDRFAEEYDVVALDLPGCARSDTSWIPYDVPDVAAALELFLDALGASSAATCSRSAAPR